MAPPRRSPAELVASAALAALGDEPTQRPPAAVLAAVVRWLDGQPGHPELPSAEEAIPLALRAGLQHGWPPALARWCAFKAEAAREVRRAVGYAGPFSEADFGAWLEGRVRERWPAGTVPCLGWLEGLYRECFPRYGRPAPPGLPDWWPQVVGPPAAPADAEDDPDCFGFAETQCQGHPALRSCLRQLYAAPNVFRFRSGRPLTYLDFLRLRYWNFPGLEGPTPTAFDLAPHLGVAANTVDVYLVRVRERLLELLQQARDGGGLRVSAAWMDRVLPPPNRFAVAWPLTAGGNGGEEEEVVHVGLFAWALPSSEQLHALTEEECQGRDALRRTCQALGGAPVPLAQGGEPMSALEFVHACYRNRLGARFAPPTADVLAQELRAAGFVREGPEGPNITAGTVRAVLNLVRREVERLLQAAWGRGEIRAPEGWARLALPQPAMYTPGHLFYPLPEA